MDPIQVEKNKMLRGQVLRTVNLFYPNPITIQNLKHSLMARGVTITADIQKTLHYMVDKEYIRIKEGGLTDIQDDDLVELSSKGVDLIEGSIHDPGVTL